MINMIARFVGAAVVLIAPIRRIKLTFEVHLGLQVLGYLLICLTHFFPEIKPFSFPTAYILSGYGSAVNMFPYLLLYKCFLEGE